MAVSVYDVKRFQPGFIGNTGPVVSFNKLVDCHAHDSSTLTGNSGSALISLDTGKVVGLHFWGRYRKWNWAVRASDLALDSRVVDAGVQFDGTPAPAAGAWDAWWQRISPLEASTPLSVSAAAGAASETIRVTIPIELVLNIGRPTTKGG